MWWLLIYHFTKSPVGSAAQYVDPQTPAGHGPVRPHTVTSVRGNHMDVIVITDITPKAELEEAMTHLAATAARLPRHYVDRRAAIHARIDALLDDWQATS